MTHTRLSRFAWSVLVYGVLVLLFGAFVRASYSGDGCGASWPICGDTLLPSLDKAPRLIEFTHRVTSGLVALACAGLYLWARRAYPRLDPVRKAAGLALVSCIVSALIGALLVKFQWVTSDKSFGRAVTMPLHLMNNYFLIGSLACAGYWSGGGSRPRSGAGGGLRAAVWWAFGGMFLLGATGAFSALGKTAFEHELSFAKDFAERLYLHVGPNAHPLLRGGIVHPLIATSVGLLLVWICGAISHMRPTSEVRGWARATVSLYVVQMGLGVVNLVASAPITLQILHLAVALLNWLAFVMLAVSALGAEPQSQEASEPEHTGGHAAPPAAGVVGFEATTPTWKDYIALTKPRIISLLLFTTVAAMFVAQRGVPPMGLLLAVSLGGYMAAGAANAFNMVIERDLDIAMGRTSHRPTVRNAVTNRQALTFAWALAAGSFAVLWAAANLLSALMALAGLLCYVFVYTIWLKRRTWQNIVIGGAAGAFPPLVGYAAVSGTLSPLAWYLFAVIFLWTPVHFWALALLIKEDYARANVPMLPVVKGDRVTVHQIGLYTALTALVSILPFCQGQAGLTYLAGSVLLNVGLIVQSAKLWRVPDRPQAKALFKYSMVYLALFFIVVALDQARFM